MAIYVLLGVQVVLLIAVFLFTAVSLRQRRDDQRTASEGDAWEATLGGFTAPFVALIAWLLDCGFSVGVGLGVAERLGQVVVTTSVARAESVREGSPSRTRWHQTFLANGSVFVAVALPAGLLLLTVQAHRNRQLRRVVGVLWDIVTFWPRANHPLTPPCYAERTVPELLKRIRVLVEQGDIVIVAAHSQGTVIAAATLLRANEDDAHVGLLTFGSPLRRLYARNFPAYFGTGALPELCRRQRPRWINLWALSDPIGSWVNDGDLEMDEQGLKKALQDVDFRLRDVEGLKKKPDRTYPPICGHSGFWNRREYYEAVNVLDSKLTPTAAKTDTSAIAPPTAQYM